MAYLEAKVRNGKAYYYLTHNRRVGGKWKKTRQYLGTSAPAVPAAPAPSLSSAYRAALPKIRRLANNRKVSACYLFGSYARGAVSPHDIDICVVSKGLSPDEMSRMALGFEKPIDLSFIERMPHYIAINVLKEGRPIFISDRRGFEEKWLETVREHIESQPMRERIYAGVERWMSSQTQ